jgi:hypothetical protein
VPSVGRVKRLSLPSAAYIAGLMDGEGTITLTRLHAREHRRLVVSIANTELALLRLIQARPGHPGAGFVRDADPAKWEIHRRTASTAQNFEAEWPLSLNITSPFGVK